jgi:hypothetical protein
MNADQMTREQREEIVIRGSLIRRLRHLGVDPVVHPLTPTQFYWDVLRESERGGN